MGSGECWSHHRTPPSAHAEPCRSMSGATEQGSTVIATKPIRRVARCPMPSQQCARSLRRRLLAMTGWSILGANWFAKFYSAMCGMDSRFRGNDSDEVFRKPLCLEYKLHRTPPSAHAEPRRSMSGATGRREAPLHCAAASGFSLPQPPPHCSHLCAQRFGFVVLA